MTLLQGVFEWGADSSSSMPMTDLMYWGDALSIDLSFAAMKRRFMVARDVEVSLMLKKPREVDVVAAETVGERYIEAPPRPMEGRMYNPAVSLVCSFGV